MSAVGAVGRKTLRGKNKFEHVGIVVGADPSRIGELEVASCGVGEKRGEFQRKQFEIDAHAAPLLLQHSADEAGLFLGGSFQREMGRYCGGA